MVPRLVIVDVAVQGTSSEVVPLEFWSGEESLKSSEHKRVQLATQVIVPAGVAALRSSKHQQQQQQRQQE